MKIIDDCSVLTHSFIIISGTPPSHNRSGVGSITGSSTCSSNLSPGVSSYLRQNLSSTPANKGNDNFYFHFNFFLRVNSPSTYSNIVPNNVYNNMLQVLAADLTLAHLQDPIKSTPMLVLVLPLVEELQVTAAIHQTSCYN